ncbi:hypothetical protein [Nonomuraea sp. JJY05]|jgi:hypothetical protein|uniref:hypothetical protein n=1 Tax=Nonomuraea sp. JJY05 TaxID=3350255 RepID=UPI00373F9CAD
MRLWDGTQIIKPNVDRGLSEWSAMAEDLERESAKLVAQVQEALDAAPWGPGAEGEAFRAAHFRNDGPNQMLLQCTKLAEQITAAGCGVRTAVDNTLKMDLDIKRDMAAGLVREI